MAGRNSRGGAVFKALGRMVGLLLGLYVFDQILTAIWPVIQISTFFATTVTFANTMLPIMGILGLFEIIWDALIAAGIM